MSIPPNKIREIKEAAYQAIRNARDIEALRQAQAVVLNLDTELDADQIANIVGLSKNWVSQLKGKFIRGQLVNRSAKGGRRNQIMTLQQEQIFMGHYINQGKGAARIKAKELKLELEKHLGRQVSMASIYNLINRHHKR